MLTTLTLPSRWRARSAQTRGWIGLTAMLAACSLPDPGERVRVVLPEEASFETIAESLAVHDIIKSADAFRLYARMSGQKDSIQSGVYYLIRGKPLGEVLGRLVQGPSFERLILPEGVTLAEAARAVERDLGIPADSFLVTTRDTNLRARVGTAGETLEGYLYPATYYFAVGAGAGEVVERMVSEFERRWIPEWSARLDSLGFTRDELVTLASIIEGEVRDDSDRRYVSSVYHNRLERGMRLQADPTVVYALGKRRRLFNRDYRVRSPYNTYLIDGLPPGPINQPSTPSIEAALYPSPTDFYYFVAGRDGKHVFSRTYREHLATIRDVRRPGSRAEGAR